MVKKNEFWQHWDTFSNNTLFVIQIMCYSKTHYPKIKKKCYFKNVIQKTRKVPFPKNVIQKITHLPKRDNHGPFKKAIVRRRLSILDMLEIAFLKVKIAEKNI